VVEGEDGHTSLAVQNEFEGALLHHVHSQLGRVSYEAILSGSGLVRLYHAVVAITGMAPATGATDGFATAGSHQKFRGDRPWRRSGTGRYRFLPPAGLSCRRDHSGHGTANQPQSFPPRL